MYTSFRFDSGCSQERTPRGAKGRDEPFDRSGAGSPRLVERIHCPHPGGIGPAVYGERPVWL